MLVGRRVAMYLFLVHPPLVAVELPSFGNRRGSGRCMLVGVGGSLCPPPPVLRIYFFIFSFSFSCGPLSPGRVPWAGVVLRPPP